MWILALSAALAQDLELDETIAAFEAHSGARLVFAASDLPSDVWFDTLVPFDDEIARARAARIALEQARRYPPGYLTDAGIRAVGLFAAVGSTENDGFHDWDEAIGAYAYYGGWNGRDTIVAAAYTERQLPLTLNHEIFHAVDQVGGSAKDDARFAAAIHGSQPYAAPTIAEADLAALRAIRSAEIVLSEAVSDYAAKNPGEDQAETARHLQAWLPEALVQVVERPELPGSQRFLHVLSEYASVPGGPGVEHWVDVALGRDSFEQRATSVARWREKLRPDGEFVVWGEEDPDGVNWTLRAQIATFGTESAALALTAPPSQAPRVVATELEQLAFLADYHAFIASRWEVTDGTRQHFDDARMAIAGALPDAYGPLARALEAASLEDLAALPDEVLQRPDRVVGELAARGVRVNRDLRHVERIGSAEVQEAIRRVQPATVAVRTARGAGSGVNLGPDGLILTAAHVPKRLGADVEVEFPDGSRFAGKCVSIDTMWDLALIDVDGGALPWAPLAPAAPEEGDEVVVIGQPGTLTPQGDPTGYQPFWVSVGEIRGFTGDRLGEQSLGVTKHDAWTYWGHSGSPLFDEQGRIVAMHNSWDPETAMRHAVTWEAIDAFVP